MPKESMFKKKTTAIPVDSEMENFKEQTYFVRRPSCPIVVMDESQNHFRIYDKEYAKQNYMQEKITPTNAYRKNP